MPENNWIGKPLHQFNSYHFKMLEAVRDYPATPLGRKRRGVRLVDQQFGEATELATLSAIRPERMSAANRNPRLTSSLQAVWLPAVRS
jgi:hypothetical protein